MNFGRLKDGLDRIVQDYNEAQRVCDLVLDKVRGHPDAKQIYLSPSLYAKLPGMAQRQLAGVVLVDPDLTGENMRVEKGGGV